MAEGEALGRAFAADHPGEAADVLEGVPAAAVAAFLAEVPAADAAAVLAAMLPGPAAGVVAAMAPEAGAAALRNVPPERAAALLRCLDRDRREALVTELRPGRRAAVKLLLAYPADTVGAWADPRVLAVRRDASVGRARRAVRDSGTPAGCDLYVVDGQRRLAGTVPVGKLLRLDPEAALARAMEPEVAALIPLVGAYVICGLFTERTRVPAMVKWPNDVMVPGGKMAGILAEYGGRKEPWLVVGFGLNLEDRPEVDHPGGMPAAAWSGYGEPPAPEEAQELVLEGLDRLWPDGRGNPLPAIRSRVERMLWMRGREVRASVSGRTLRGVVEGLDDLGHLRLYGPDGAAVLDSGEIRPEPLESPTTIPGGAT